ncbi:hypothetical protein [Propionicicella superfundia]|uniref:hypothetical protein n=1 Tax=Propionicicella superfundia TaxID=348582 RepID=UPI00048C1E62|nr:hypothetical protein [Propionicicella superfundia]
MTAGIPIVVDACVLINLEATGHLDAIVRMLDLDMVVTEPARAEVGSLRGEVDGITQTFPIQLEHHIGSGALTVTALKPEELSTYVELALELGDGEASSIAVAANRGLAIATDDRKARRVSLERGLAEPKRTTRILRDYCNRARCESPVVRGLLQAIQHRASFVPPRSDPDHDWWRTHIGE